MADAIGAKGIGPETLGKYVLIDRIAMGGMAEVYVAQKREPGHAAIPVCVKRMLPHLADDEQYIAMFRDEARIASFLDHPNLVRQLELGQEGDQYYIAMELVPGEPLGRLLQARTGRDEGRRGGRSPSSHRGLRAVGRPDVARGLSPRLALYVVTRAAAALHHAHQLVDTRGRAMRVIHRDVSPDNILVTFGGAVKVIDFGVARAQGRLTQTQAGVAKGKFAYMSPEQARGGEVDHRSDVFALGVVLWETLSGRRLFQRDSDRETIRAILNDPVPPLSTFGSIPVELDLVIERALQKSPASRFPTAEHLRAALEGILAAIEPELGEEDLPVALGRLTRELLETRYVWWKQMVRRAADRTASMPLPSEVLPNVPVTTESATAHFIEPDESTTSLRSPWRPPSSEDATPVDRPVSRTHDEAPPATPDRARSWQPRPWMIAIAGFGTVMLVGSLWLHLRGPVPPSNEHPGGRTPAPGRLHPGPVRPGRPLVVPLSRDGEGGPRQEPARGPGAEAARGPVAPPRGPVAPPRGPVAPPRGPVAPPRGPVAAPTVDPAPVAETSPLAEPVPAVEGSNRAVLLPAKPPAARPARPPLGQPRASPDDVRPEPAAAPEGAGRRFGNPF